jgi:hypothetical protein
MSLLSIFSDSGNWSLPKKMHMINLQTQLVTRVILIYPMIINTSDNVIKGQNKYCMITNIEIAKPTKIEGNQFHPLKRLNKYPIQTVSLIKNTKT